VRGPSRAIRRRWTGLHRVLRRRRRWSGVGVGCPCGVVLLDAAVAVVGVSGHGGPPSTCGPLLPVFACRSCGSPDACGYGGWPDFFSGTVEAVSNPQTRKTGSDLGFCVAGLVGSAGFANPQSGSNPRVCGFAGGVPESNPQGVLPLLLLVTGLVGGFAGLRV
jgi:hypothetical protein